MTANDVYASNVVALPASEKLRLASLILEGLSKSGAALDYSEHWSDEDVRDVVAFSAQQTDVRAEE